DTIGVQRGVQASICVRCVAQRSVPTDQAVPQVSNQLQPRSTLQLGKRSSRKVEHEHATDLRCYHNEASLHDLKPADKCIGRLPLAANAEAHGTLCAVLRVYNTELRAIGGDVNVQRPCVLGNEVR